MDGLKNVMKNSKLPMKAKLLKYASFELKMIIGGPRIHDDACKKAAQIGCMFVRASACGGRYKLDDL